VRGKGGFFPARASGKVSSTDLVPGEVLPPPRSRPSGKSALRTGSKVSPGSKSGREQRPLDSGREKASWPSLLSYHILAISLAKKILFSQKICRKPQLIIRIIARNNQIDMAYYLQKHKERREIDEELANGFKEKP